jgi:hypothetical protein
MLRRSAASPIRRNSGDELSAGEFRTVAAKLPRNSDAAHCYAQPIRALRAENPIVRLSTIEVEW